MSGQKYRDQSPGRKRNSDNPPRLTRLARDLVKAKSMVALASVVSRVRVDPRLPETAENTQYQRLESRAAVLHCRSPSGMNSIAGQDSVPSKAACINRMVERVLAEATSPDPVRFHQGPWRVLASRIRHTGWLLIWIHPVASPPQSTRANP